MVTIIACDGYKDDFGNEIIGVIRNLKIIFKGKNAKLKVGNDFKALGEANTFIFEDDCVVEIGDNFQMGRNNTFYFRNGSKFSLGNNALITNYFRLYNKGRISIGNNFGIRDFGELRVLGEVTMSDWVYFQHHATIYAPKYTKLIFGTDSGSSWYAKITAGSGHSLYDLKHGMKLNDIQGKSITEIGSHIWIGSGATINGSVRIGDDSVVAANSNVTTGDFPKNSLIGGSPAKIIASNIDWDRRIDLGYDEFIEYKNSNNRIVERATYLEEFCDDNLNDELYLKK